MDYNPIIVALDGKGYDESLEIAERLRGRVAAFKVNDLFFDMGVAIVQELEQFGPVMLDAKLHDIPNTVGNTAKRFAGTVDATIITVHASGGPDMIRAAVEHLPGRIAAVTVLTSLDVHNVHRVFGRLPEIEVTELVKIAVDGGASYIVCSPKELGLSVFREDFKEFMGRGSELKKIVPGIRPLWFQEKGDQKRTATPAEAMEAGADFLVMGRAILGADDPVEAIERTLEEIRKGVSHVS